jgi:hypothetical protein
VVMHRLITIGVTLFIITGCAVAPPVTSPVWETTNVFQNNPVLLPVSDHHLAWETVVDVLDDYFKIEREEPMRRVGDTVTDGRLDTFPAIGSTVFEPWRHDSASPYEKLESTLQSIRREAVVRVSPTQGGYLVDVAVFKELEDVAQPMHATAGAATFRNDASLTRVVGTVGDQDVHEDWIRMGRDTALEQRIIAQLLARVGAGQPPIVAPGPSPCPPAGQPQYLPLPAPPSTELPATRPGSGMPG